ncbi:hypothetical protein B9Z55_019092 [Caenorhabditis nigoni]|uniref:Uncharacterized protein n=2 Tax=Caenorhabditis nigoni TaxID=1611254 RepID=A0A2G5THN1_9PELO|nr:hypothetical protein B9Z55_019092 [Caenorhabditis nigoni]
MGLGMGMPMGMPMMMPMHHQLVGNPYDQGLEIEYSPITQLVSSVAHLFEMHQKSKEREDEHGITSDHHSSSNLQGSMFPELSQLQTSMRGRPGIGNQIPLEMIHNRPKFNLIPYSHGIGPSELSSTSKLINSIPRELFFIFFVGQLPYFL